MAKRTPGLLLAARIIDVVAAPLTAAAGVWLKTLRKLGLQFMPISKRVLLAIGVFPIRDHYYEPMINPKHLRRSLTQSRALPGIDLNLSGQLALLAQFKFQNELAQFPLQETDKLKFYYHNPSFGTGDAEYLYSLIRLMRPRRLIEVGSGFSTLMAGSAIVRNKEESADYACDHRCIEPYEQPWLESLGIKIMRCRVEDTDLSLFRSLERNDILFIDSSHVIRPQGDVLFEYLELLPSLQSGVFVHIHDIFTPRDYPPEWIVDETRLWNEQYLVEAFLSFNSQFRIVGALNYLFHDHRSAVLDKFPMLEAEFVVREPGSLWLQRA
jgi:hypothetical protein